MTRITFSISNDLKNKMDSMKDINWSEVLKHGLEKKLTQLEKLQHKGEI